MAYKTQTKYYKGHIVRPITRQEYDSMLDFSDSDLEEIDICLNCEYPKCNGMCDKIKAFRGKKK